MSAKSTDQMLRCWRCDQPYRTTDPASQLRRYGVCPDCLTRMATHPEQFRRERTP